MIVYATGVIIVVPHAAAAATAMAGGLSATQEHGRVVRDEDSEKGRRSSETPGGEDEDREESSRKRRAPVPHAPSLRISGMYEYGILWVGGFEILSEEFVSGLWNYLNKICCAEIVFGSFILHFGGFVFLEFFLERVFSGKVFFNFRLVSGIF